MRQGIALVISAPSGTGKSTLTRLLLQEFPDFGFSVSCTTRPPREDEVDGRDYLFIDRADFERRKKHGEFAEWAEVHGHLYGTLLSPLQAMLQAGQDVIFDIDVQGAAQLKSSLEAAKFVFLLPPSLAELERRLRTRGQDAEDAIRVRLENARREISQAEWYDALIVNENLNGAYSKLRGFYLCSILSPQCNKNLVPDLLAGNTVAQSRWLN